LPKNGPVPPLPLVLRQLADLSEIRGEIAESADLRRAADVIESLGPAGTKRAAQHAGRNRLQELRIAPSLGWRIREITDGGAPSALHAALSAIPSDLRNLVDAGLNVGDAVALARVDVLTLDDLSAVEHGSLAARLGVAADAISRTLRTLEHARPALPLGRACDALDRIVAAIGAQCDGLMEVAIAGGVRRGEPTVHGLTLAASTASPAATIDCLLSVPAALEVLHRSPHRAILLFESGQVDVRVATPDAYGSAMVTATGPGSHLAALRMRAADLGVTLAAHATEPALYDALGMPYIAPELRGTGGEIEAALDGRLPRLVTRADIRGDLHMHSDWSDGKDALEQVVEAAAARGYDYIAITDHSNSAAASRTLSRDDLYRQVDAIRALQPRYPRMKILCGCEVDIMPDGSLDFSDDVLAQLDIVLASLHQRAGHDGAALTARCLAAIAHPLVNVITHPANRLVGRRPGYDLDFDRLFAAAAETGTLLEIDGAPAHLDLDGALARRAIAAGATVVIDSDCHRAAMLERQMQLGVATARRGWVEPRHVLNTRPLEEVLAFFARKRQRTG
jgi:DNA polymerase (family 10)